eukprot:5906702-Pyramimonas_sp.AAC.2
MGHPAFRVTPGPQDLFAQPIMIVRFSFGAHRRAEMSRCSAMQTTRGLVAHALPFMPAKSSPPLL